MTTFIEREQIRETQAPMQVAFTTEGNVIRFNDEYSLFVMVIRETDRGFAVDCTDHTEGDSPLRCEIVGASIWGAMHFAEYCDSVFCEGWLLAFHNWAITNGYPNLK